MNLISKDRENIVVERDAEGFYWHPDFPWDEIPEDTNMISYIKSWGYKPYFILLEDDNPELAKKYFELLEFDINLWTPEHPGKGWFLGAIYDTEDGPVALWMKRK